MSLKWSPPQRKKLTMGGSKALLSSTTSSTSISSSNPSLAATIGSTSKLINLTKSTAYNYNPQIQDHITQQYQNHRQQQHATNTKQQHTSAPLKLSSTKTSIKRSATNEQSTHSSMFSVYSTNSTNPLLTSRDIDDDINYGLYHKYSSHQYHHHNHHHHSHHANSYAGGRIGGTEAGGASDGGSSSRLVGTSAKRGKKQNWPSRERAGMSFLIVIIFFAVFGIIILMELFMIDDRSRTGMMVLRHGNNYGSRSGDSMPDYDNVKDDYDLLDENLLSDNKLGFVQFRDNKLNIQDADGDANGRVAGVLINSGGESAARGGGSDSAAPGGAAVRTSGGGMGAPPIPWGKILPAKVEETLPHYPIGVQPIDGVWQVVNGTRFKFFVFSAYYDRRDGAKLVRVIGATKTRTPERVWCRFWYPKEPGHHTPSYVSATVMARVKVIRENWNLKYSAVFVLCPVRSGELEVPRYVSIVARLRAPPGNLMRLRNTDWDPDFAHLRTPPPTANSNNHSAALSNATTLRQQEQRTLLLSHPQSQSKQLQQRHQYKTPATMSPLGAQYLPFGLPSEEQIPDKIAVCVKPFHFNYDQALYLMEFIEFYALMGVAHFTFYNHTLGPHATCVLQHYIDGDVPNMSSAWDVDLAEVLGKGMTLMGQDAAKVDAVLSGYYNPNASSSSSSSSNNNINLNTNNYNINNNNDNVQSANHKSNVVSANNENRTNATSTSHSTQQTQSSVASARAYESEVTGALQPPPPPQSPRLLPKPPLQQQHGAKLPPVKRYKSLSYAKPTINILPWNLRMRSQKEIRTEGLFAALNDCLYRTMHRYRYLAMVDLDEFIVPRHNDTLNELINSLNHRFRYRNLGAYSFQNAFFYLQFPDDPLVTQPQPQPPPQAQQEPYAHTNPLLRAALLTQRKTRRRLKLHPQKQRSKYICKPESVIEAGNHFVWEFSPAKGSLNVPPIDGILQHYRVCEFGGNDCIKAPSVVDRTATKYVNRLVERVELVYKHLKKRCDLPALPNEPPEEPRQQNQQRKLQSKSTDTHTKNDDERIKILANVKSKRDNDHEGNSRNSETTIEKSVVKSNSLDPVASETNHEYKEKRKQRKVVVFEQDENGIPMAHVEYVDT
ncbi:uncharacterized protein [Eurosta solidaginis]|uniref:uncharacterized protein isoform X2 n=1 Tax=Eurosta solidaginis TaxID=178769 RepID=UPI003530A22B